MTDTKKTETKGDFIDEGDLRSPLIYAEKINKRIEGLTKKWIELAKILVEAKKTLNKKEFKDLKYLINLTDSTIHKLLNIGHSQRLTQNPIIKERVKNWNILYELTLLDNDQFDEVNEKYFVPEKAPQLMLRDLKELRGLAGKSSRDKDDKTKPLIQVRIDPDKYESAQQIEDLEKRMVEVIHEQFSPSDSSILIEHFELAEKLERKHEQENKRQVREMEQALLSRRKAQLLNIKRKAFETLSPKAKHLKKWSKAKQFEQKYGLEVEGLTDPESYEHNVKHLGHEVIEYSDL